MYITLKECLLYITRDLRHGAHNPKFLLIECYTELIFRVSDLLMLHKHAWWCTEYTPMQGQSPSRAVSTDPCSI